MQLIDFPNEILLKIISEPTILTITDLLSFSLSCRRLSFLVLPQIYKSITFIDTFPKSNIAHRLEFLNNILTTSSQRKYWLNTATFAWTGEDAEHGIPWLTRAKMFGILGKLPSLRSLEMAERNQRCFTPDEIVPLGPAKLLLRYTSSFQHLRHLTLDDFMITTEDIAGFFTWPSLTHHALLGRSGSVGEERGRGTKL